MTEETGRTAVKTERQIVNPLRANGNAHATFRHVQDAPKLVEALEKATVDGSLFAKRAFCTYDDSRKARSRRALKARTGRSSSTARQMIGSTRRVRLAYGHGKAVDDKTAGESKATAGRGRAEEGERRREAEAIVGGAHRIGGVNLRCGRARRASDEIKKEMHREIKRNRARHGNAVSSSLVVAAVAQRRGAMLFRAARISSML